MTPEQKTAQRIAQKRYRNSPKGKATLKRFNHSAKGRAWRKAYAKSGKGKKASHKYYLTLKAKLRFILKRVLTRHNERWPNDPTFLSFTDMQEIWERQDGLCALSGLKMTWGQRSVQATSISVDRIDNARGYHPDNIRFLCHNVNAFRGTGSDEAMIEMAKAILDFAQLPF